MTMMQSKSCVNNNNTRNLSWTRGDVYDRRRLTGDAVEESVAPPTSVATAGTYAIIGVVVGGLLLIALLVDVSCYFINKRGKHLFILLLSVLLLRWLSRQTWSKSIGEKWRGFLIRTSSLPTFTDPKSSIRKKGIFLVCRLRSSSCPRVACHDATRHHQFLAFLWLTL